MPYHVFVCALHSGSSSDSVRLWANSQEPCELEKKPHNRKRHPQNIETPGPRATRGLLYVCHPPLASVRAGHGCTRGCTGPTLEEHFLYISLSVMQQITGYVIKAAQARRQRKGNPWRKILFCYTEKGVWKCLVPCKHRESLEDEE